MRVSGGSVFILNGHYVVQWRGIDGKVKTKTLKDSAGQYPTNKKDAQKLASEVLSEHHKARIEAESINNRLEAVQKVAGLKGLLHRCTVPVSKMLEAWQQSPSYTSTDAEAKVSAIAHFQSFLSESYPNLKGVADVSADVAAKYMHSYWLSGISGKTHNMRLLALKVVFKTFAPDDNPFDAIQKKPEESQAKQPFSTDQLAQIWRVLSDDDYYMLHKAEMRDMYVLALHSGLRCVDCCLLQWSSVDMAQRLLAVTPKKTRKSSRAQVVIPMSEPLYSMLSRRQSAACDSVFVFPDVAARYSKNRFGISADTQKLLEAAGIKTQGINSGIQRKRPITLYGFHSFRHTFATGLANAGVSPLVVKDILGHSTVAMTSHYSHISIDAKREALKLMSPDPKPETYKLSADSIKGIPAVKLAEFLSRELSAVQLQALMALSS